MSNQGTNGWITENGISRRITPIDQLKDYVVDINTGCHVWTRAKTKQGYGRMREKVNGKRKVLLAHRVAYEHYRGAIPAELIVRHFFCNNTSCINPDHLELGTYKDNTQDALRAGRFAIGSRAGTAKLVEEDIITIRSLLAKGYTIAAVARLFNRGETTIRQVKQGTTWRHVS